MNVNYGAIAPEIVVTSAACVVLLGDLALRSRARAWTGYLTIVALVVAALIEFPMLLQRPSATLGGLFVLDHFSVVLKTFFLVVAVFVTWIAIPPLRGHRYEGEFYFLFLCSVLGTMLMPSSRELLMLFVSLELVSAPAFVMTGLRKLNPRSNEAALKFFIFGVLSAGIFVYGISLVYGAVGSTSLRTIGAATATMARPEPVLLIGVLFIIGAFAFKVSAVPFHFWAPDTYEGAPTPLAAFLSVASKAAGFVGLLLILLIGFPSLSRFWGPVVGAIAIATMTIGNVVALRQRHLVRLLAYSSIGHAGYMLIPLAIIVPYQGSIIGSNAAALRSLVTYLFLYAAMNLGAFAVAIGISKQYPTLLVRDLAGLGRRAALPAIALATFLISLGGIPPLAGWFAKFVVFKSAVEAGSSLGVVLAVAMVLNSVVSLYYYVGVVRVMFLQDPEDGAAPVAFPTAITIAIVAALVAVLALGVYPQPAAKLAELARLAVHLSP